MHWFLIEVKPKPTNKIACEEVHVALVSIWINFPDFEAAEVIAKYYINEEGWDVQSVKNHEWVCAEDYEYDQCIKHYQRALDYGSSFTFHMCKKNAPNTKWRLEGIVH